MSSNIPRIYVSSFACKLRNIPINEFLGEEFEPGMLEAGTDADREAEPGRWDDQRTLVSTASWQRERLASGNVVDAMALVRRSAWEQVGGYTHIEGGWEDYDFWCKLIETDFSGILCPQRLARYHCHTGSMLATQTHHRLRAISRVLQHRHPWLQLYLATPCV